MKADLEVPRCALVVGAHPDDCEFGAGGTVGVWARHGCRVHFLVVTDGCKGSADPDCDEAALIRRRREEQLTAAEVLGVTSCRFLEFTDGEVTNDLGLLKEIVRALRELKPEVVLTHSSESLDHRRFDGRRGPWVNHRDHRAVGQATLDAVYPYARNAQAFPELGLACHKVKQVYLWGSRFAESVFDCTELLDTKVLALAAHRSQFPEGTDWEALKGAWGPSESFEMVELES